MMTYYLVQEIAGGEYNLLSGSEEECKEYMQELIAEGQSPEDFYITTNRFN